MQDYARSGFRQPGKAIALSPTRVFQGQTIVPQAEEIDLILSLRSCEERRLLRHSPGNAHEGTNACVTYRPGMLK